MPSVLTHCSRQYSVVSSSLLGTYSIPTTPIHIHPSRHCIASLLNTGRDIREQSQLSVQWYRRCCGDEEVVGIEERSSTICLHFCPRTYYSHFKLTPPYILYCTIESIPGILAKQHRAPPLDCIVRTRPHTPPPSPLPPSPASQPASHPFLVDCVP